MTDSPGSGALPRLAIERLLFLGRDGALDDLMTAAPDAWSMTLPGLDSFTRWPANGPRPRICIATEQIAGPIRNGGIGNTYAALAVMLAQAGYDTTVLYLRGETCETMTMAHWVDDYAGKGVKLVPVPDYAARDQLRTGADRWLHAPYNMMRWLSEHPMDVVHVSEWRGSAYLCLLAKRQGLAFDQTLFLVKTSSPWMWNRLYGARPIEKLEDLAKVHAERQSVELADVVIGGSLHLLRWMASQGYALPRGRTFVQPNVVTFSRLEPLMSDRFDVGGTRMPIDEFVFFGRLEPRKGLFLFCQAIRRLIRKGITLPPRITFMGKPGGRMPSHPDIEADAYLRLVTADWPTEVEILTQYQQYDAVKYLLSGRRLAVMPSIIENSSMAVYEAAICGIPCVASDVGGNAELILLEDHDQVLCEPHPVALGNRLEEALADGGYVPRPSFDNDDNLAIWRLFHRQLGGPLRSELLHRNRAAVATAAGAAATSVCIYCTGSDAALAATLASLAAQTVLPREVLIGVDAESADAGDIARKLAAGCGLAARVVEAYDLDAGAGFNLMAREAAGDFVHFLWEGATLVPDAIATLQRAAGTSGAMVLTYLHGVGTPSGCDPSVLYGVILGSVSDLFFRAEMNELPLFVRRATFEQMGGFSEDYRVTGADYEFVTRAMVAGMVCQTVIRKLGTILYRSSDDMRRAGYDAAAARLRAIRPLLTGAPLALRDLLLYARGTTLRPLLTGKAMATDGPAEVGASNASVIRPAVPIAPSSLGKQAKPMLPKKPVAPAARRLPPVPDVVAVRRVDTSPDLVNLSTDRSVLQRGTVIGRFLGIHEGRLYGWVYDSARPGAPVEIELAMAGAVSRHPARRRFSKWAEVPPAAARNGFTIDVPPDLRRGREATPLSLTVAGSSSGAGLVLAEGAMPPSGVTLDQCDLAGACENDADGMLTGWASYKHEPNRPVTLAAYVQGLFIGRFQANDAHPKVPTGVGGFRCEIPEALRAEGRIAVDVVVADVGVALRQSPVRVDGLRVSVSRWQAIGNGR